MVDSSDVSAPPGDDAEGARDSRRPVIEPEACPLLGLAEDRRSRFTFANPGHRCYAGDRPAPIDAGHQAAFCLAATYADCPRYRAAPAAATEAHRARSGNPGAPTARTASVPTAVAATSDDAAAGAPLVPAARTAASPGADVSATGTDPTEATRGVAGAWISPQPIQVPATGARARRSRSGPPAPLFERRSSRLRIVTALLIVAGTLAGAAWVGGRALDGGGPGSPAPASVRPVASEGVAAGTSVAPAPTATPTGLPTPGPTDQATPGPTPGPTPTPQPVATPTPAPRIHVVVAGETLISIADRFGVTWQSIQRANNIRDPGLIHIGQRLVIPPKP